MSGTPTSHLARPVTIQSTGMSLATCDYCQASIAWVTLPSGKRHPVDADSLVVLDRPLTHNVLISPDRPTQQLYRKDRGLVLASQLMLGVSHFATCTHAAEAREDARRRREERSQS